VQGALLACLRYFESFITTANDGCSQNALITTERRLKKHSAKRKQTKKITVNLVKLKPNRKLKNRSRNLVSRAVRRPCSEFMDML